MTRLGVLGGTFDPPHFGHLVIAQEAAFALGLERVLFAPARMPPHKLGEPLTPAGHRIRMTELAIAGSPTFELSTADLEGTGPSYTLDLIDRLKAERGSWAEIAFIVGMDSLAELPSWREPENVLDSCLLVAVQRPGQAQVDLRQLGEAIAGRAHKICVLEAPGVEVSSTLLRERVARGEPIRYLTPDSVVDYIQSEGLYRGI